MTGEFVTAGHLGGYVAGGDPATFYPELWAWLARFHARSLIDVGCGDGAALRYLRGLGCDAVGVEGVPQDDPSIVRHDYATGPYVPGREFDVCWSCEFVEHVEERYVPNFLETFRSARWVLMTHADPGQAGHHHVNCRTSLYWTRRLREVGYELDETMTRVTRGLAAANRNPWNHYLRSGLAFRRA